MTPESSQSLDKRISQIGYRLKMRKQFIHRLKIIADINSVIAIISIILMVVANELTFRREHDANTQASWIIKAIITILTALQLAFVILYKYFDFKLYAIQNAIGSFVAVITYERLFFILIELSICIIHPVPRTFPKIEPSKINDADIQSYSLDHTSIDIVLSLIMFLRLYLITRSIMFHSHLIRDTTLRSFGYLNRVTIDFAFLFKTYLLQRPFRSITVVSTIIFFIGSWSLRACDYNGDRRHFSMSNSMWIFAVTFTTVGYGDIYPSTYCGRTIAVLIALFGLLVSALLIAVSTQKFLLSREELYVHTFVMRANLLRQRQIQAANTVKFAIKLWYLKQKRKDQSLECMHIQRRLFQSISNSKGIIDQQTNLSGNCLGLIELHATQQNTNAQQDTIAKQLNEIRVNMINIENQLNNLTDNMKGVNHYRL